MPYVLPGPLRASERFALVLSFGRLSVLEACSVVSGIKRVENPVERIAVVSIAGSSSELLTRLAGIHKLVPLIAQFDGESEGASVFAETIAKELDSVDRLALSGYGVPEDDYEVLVRALLDAFRAKGFTKIRLLRPKGNELIAAEVMARKALDVVAFPYERGYAIGPTAWVSNVASIRRRALAKPVPRSEISLSPRLARLLVNLSGLSAGQVLLDPFCGTGTILAEGLARSLDCVGVDSSRARLLEAKRNLEWARREGARGRFRLEVGDATELRLSEGATKADGVVTEPLLLPRLDYAPNTEAAHAMMEEAGRAYAGALSSMTRVVKPGARIVIVVPILRTSKGAEASIALEGGPLGLRLYQPGPSRVEYPVRLSFESTRWVRRAVYVFESRS